MSEPTQVAEEQRSRARIPQLEAEIVALKREIDARDVKLSQAYAESERTAARLEVTQAIVTAILRGLEGDTE